MSISDGSTIFTANLKRLIAERDVTQAEVAKGIGVTQGIVSMWVRGASYPRLGLMEKLAAYFDVPVTALTSDTNTPTDPLITKFNDLIKNLSDSDKEWLLDTLQRLTKDK